MSFRITPEPIASLPSEPQPAAGGYVVFEGRVRNLNEGRQVLSLEYEAFDELAIATGEKLLHEASERFDILDARCVHRTGRLQIGEIAIRVEVAGAHRKAAFEACDWIVDEVKRQVPIWKKEHYAEGDSGWINCAPSVESSDSEYYSRQVRLPEIGAAGQRKLRDAKVLVVGAGGLGSPALLYLAAAGVGTLGLVEFDRLDESNLHRQILYASRQTGAYKATAAANRLRELNPHIQVVAHSDRIHRSNVDEILSGYEIVLDCTDNFATKFLVNDGCVRAAKALIQASIYQYEGQLLVVTPGSPCLRCLWPQAPQENCVGSCAEVGVLGVVPGVLGSLQALEAIKLILGLPSPLTRGNLLLLDLLHLDRHLVWIKKNPDCPACGSGTIDDAPYEVEPSSFDLRNYLLVDVRDADEVATEPIAGAMHVPAPELRRRPLPDAEAYLLVCETGSRSSTAAATQWNAGDRRFFSLTGGLRAHRSLFNGK